MAQEPNTEEIKRKAIQAIAESREEISTEVVQVRERLRPRRVLERAVDRHPRIAVGLAVAAGIIPVLLIFRGRKDSVRSHFPTLATAPVPPPKPVLGALLLGAAGVLVKSITPALIKSTIVPQILQFIEKKHRKAASDSPPI